MRAKMYKHHSRRHPRGKTADKCSKFGEMITADGFAAEGGNFAFGGEICADVCYDIASKWREIFPAKNKKIGTI